MIGELTLATHPQTLACRMPYTNTPRPRADRPGQPAGKGNDEDRNDDFAHEHVAPGEAGRHPPTQNRAHGYARSGDTTNDSIRNRPVSALIGAGDEGDQCRKYERGADSFQDRPADQQGPNVPRDGGQGGTRPVDDEPDDECPLSAPAITQFPAGDHQRRHGQGIEGDDTLDHGHRGLEVFDQLTDRHIHHCLVQNHEELGQAQHYQGSPLHGEARYLSRTSGDGIGITARFGPRLGL